MQTVTLHYKHSGTGPVVLILHGLFGSLDNWQSMAKLLSDHFNVYCLDLRNHGKSPHTNNFSVGLMAADVIDFINDHQFGSVHLIGHSMGGKVALEMLNVNNSLIDKVMILDIAPKSYPKGHEHIFKAMFDLDLPSLSSRNSADEQLKQSIPDFTVRQFILKNLDRDKDGKFVWKVNLNALYKNYDEINKEIIFTHRILNEILFVKGSLSGYILKDDEQIISQVLPNAKFYEIKDAGHWIHADKPDELKKLIIQFLETN